MTVIAKVKEQVVGAVWTWIKSWSRFYKVVQLHKPC